MCLSSPSNYAPAQPQAIRYQQSKEPVMRQASKDPMNRTVEKRGGRRSTILTSPSAPFDVTVAGKKTALGS